MKALINITKQFENATMAFNSGGAIGILIELPKDTIKIVDTFHKSGAFGVCSFVQVDKGVLFSLLPESNKSKFCKMLSNFAQIEPIEHPLTKQKKK